MHVNCCYVLIQMWVVPVGPAAVQVNCSNSSFATIIRALYHCLPIHAVGYMPHTGWIIFFFTRLTINRERNYNLCPASPLPGNPPPFQSAEWHTNSWQDRLYAKPFCNKGKTQETTCKWLILSFLLSCQLYIMVWCYREIIYLSHGKSFHDCWLHFPQLNLWFF